MSLPTATFAVRGIQDAASCPVLGQNASDNSRRHAEMPDPELFYSNSEDAPRAICSTCGVRAQFLAVVDQLEWPELWPRRELMKVYEKIDAPRFAETYRDS